jgi:hypothetical protein
MWCVVCCLHNNATNATLSNKYDNCNYQVYQHSLIKYIRIQKYSLHTYNESEL